MFGGKDIHHTFYLPTEHGISAQRMDKIAIGKLLRIPYRLNDVRNIGVIFVYDIGQVSTQLISVLYIFIHRN